VVFCEKPIANTVKDAEKMLAAVKKAGVIHMVCHNYRRAPAVMLARQLIADGKLGTIYHYRGTYLQDWIVDPQFPLVWRLRKRRQDRARSATSRRTRSTLARFLVGENHGSHLPRSRRSSRSARCRTTRRRRAR
jgi:hypothetical protein